MTPKNRSPGEIIDDIISTKSKIETLKLVISYAKLMGNTKEENSSKIQLRNFERRLINLNKELEATGEYQTKNETTTSKN